MQVMEEHDKILSELYSFILAAGKPSCASVRGFDNLLSSTHNTEDMESESKKFPNYFYTL